MISSLVTRNIRLADKRTSVRLEPLLWQALEDVARRQKISIHELCTQIHKTKPERGGLTSAMRVHLLGYYREALKDAEQRLAEANENALRPRSRDPQPAMLA